MLLLSRAVQRVSDKIPAGADRQVDDKAFIIKPSAGGYPATDPFLALSEDWFSHAGFDWHPHRGVETVTVVVDGVLEHGDNMGNAGVLTTGDAQWMTAGRGIIHREHAYRNEYAHTLQLWINLPATRKMTPTRYRDLRAGDLPLYAAPGVRVQTISWGGHGDVRVLSDLPRIAALAVRIEPKSAYSQALPADHRAFAYVLNGEIEIGSSRAAAGQIAWSDPATDDTLPGQHGAASYLSMRAPDSDEPAQVLLFSGRPLREPVAAGRSFVMNTQEQVRQAIIDYESGGFGEIPRTARLQ